MSTGNQIHHQIARKSIQPIGLFCTSLWIVRLQYQLRRARVMSRPEFPDGDGDLRSARLRGKVDMEKGFSQ